MAFVSRALRAVQYLPELPIAFYLFALMFSGPVQEQYSYQYFSNKLGYNYSTEHASSGNCPTDLAANSTEIKLQKEVQGMVAQFTARLTFVQNIPAIFLCLLFGPISDGFGRKSVIVASIFSALLAVVVSTITVFLEWDIKVLYASNLIIGFGGYFMAVVMAFSAYICDITEGRNRAIRIAVIDLLLLLSVTLSNYTSGAFLQKFGFKISYIFMFLLFTIALILVLFVLKESLSKENKVKLSLKRALLNSFKVIIASRPYKSTLVLFALINITMLTTSPSAVLSTLYLYLLNVPLCWDVSHIGYYRGTFLLVIGVGGVIGVKLLPKVLSTPLLLIVSLLSSAGFLVTLNYTHTVLSLYLGTLVGVFSFVAPPVLRSGMSQIVTEKEQGSMFAFLGSMQALVLMVSGISYQNLYRRLNNEGKPGLTFIFAAMTSVLPLIFIIIVWINGTKMPAHDFSCDSKNSGPDKNDQVDDENEPLLA